jgi:hypothetical protein
MTELGIIDAPKKGEGNNVSSSKKISKQLIEECITSILKAEVYKTRKPDKKGELQELPPDQLEKLGQDRIVRIYMQENIEVGCQRVVHDRILSDTVKHRNLELGEKLMLFEELLHKQAAHYNINTKAIRAKIKKDFKFLELKKHSSKNLILKYAKELNEMPPKQGNMLRLHIGLKSNVQSLSSSSGSVSSEDSDSRSKSTAIKTKQES